MLSAQTRRAVERVTWLACLIFTGCKLEAQTNQALILNDRGVDAAAHSDYVQAERLYREAIRIWRGMGSRYDAHTATTLFNLGSVLCNEGDARQGVQVLEEASELHRRALGAKHIRTVRNLSLLGYAYVQAGDLDRADATLTEALADEKELYPNDLVLAETLLSLSLSQRLRGKLDDALQLGEESLSAALRTGGELTGDAALAYENVATVHRLAGRPQRALPLFRKARFIYEHTLGPDSPPLESLISQEGLALFEDGEVGLAGQELSQAVQALTLAGPASEYRLATAEDNLALLRLRQRKFADAERLLNHALSIEQRLPSRPVFETTTTLELLVQLRKARRGDASAVRPSH
ncbi:MAG: tetratricopeptide repeat protein [Candidatus Sulfopaludibacter sp.]|nr:tetratricopeptide repeat protein [Candidatus Sulfopaludibacter sp.]